MPQVLDGALSVVHENVFLVVLFLGTSWLLYGAVWRLYLSPIASFPGPRFAALTFWNEFYYDVVCKGRYTWKIADYHKKYGPIIRINPYELHINDPDFYDVLYVGGTKRRSNKWFWSMRMFGPADYSVFDTLDHDHHRLRRGPWSPYFSKQTVSRAQPLLLQPLANKFCDRLADYQAAGKPVIMTDAFADLSADVISEYSFPQGYGNLDQSQFHGSDYHMIMAGSKLSHLAKQYSWLYPVLLSMPPCIMRYASPAAYLLQSKQLRLLRQANEIVQQRGNPDCKEAFARPSLMHAFLESDIPESEKTPERIKREAQTAIAAGTATSTHSLKTATFHVLANPPIFERFMEELQGAMAGQDSELDLHQLEQMPYLMAIWYETLRVFSGASQRLQRVFPDHALQYKQWVIPPGTPVGMTALHIHDNEEIFPDHRAFKPERWLPLQTEGQRLLKYLVAFGVGSRACVGKELGKAEFLTTFAAMFWRFGRQMQLFDTERERDIDTKHDYFNPAPSSRSNGLMVFFNKD